MNESFPCCSILKIIDDASNFDNQTDTVYATSNWFVQKHLEGGGFNVIQLETLITPAVAASVDKHIFWIIENWFRQPTDWTLFEGISLGETHWYDLLGFEGRSQEGFTASRGITVFLKYVIVFYQIIGEMRPQKIECDWPNNDAFKALQLVAQHFRIPVFCLEKSAALSKPKPISLRKNNWKIQLKQRLSPFKRRIEAEMKLKFDKPKYDIFAIAYPMMDSLLSDLKGREIRCITDRTLNPVFNSNPRDLQEAQSKYKYVTEKWIQVKTLDSYKEQFVFSHVDCWSYFESVLDEIVQEHFLRTVCYQSILKREFTKREIQLVLLPYDSPAFARLCVQVASQMKIPSLLVCHGLFQDIEQSGDMRFAQYVAALCDHDVREVERIRGHSMAQQARVVGCLQFAKYAPRPLASSPSTSLEPRKVRVLVLTMCAAFFSVASRADDPEIFLQTVIRSLEAFSSQIEVVFKLHPVEDRARYERSLEILAPSFTFDLRSGWGVEKLLTETDVVVCPFSTVMIEALHLRVPVIYLHTSSEEVGGILRSNKAIPQAFNSADLTEILKRTVEDYAHFRANYDFDLALKSFGPDDNLAVNRVVDFITDILQEKS